MTMTLDAPIWQMAIMLTFALTAISFVLQIISAISKPTDVNNNQFLLEHLKTLQVEIETLNMELHRLSIENKNLRTEVQVLTDKVIHLQNQVGTDK